MRALQRAASVTRPSWYSARLAPCLEENTLFGYVCGTLDADARERVADHAAGCDACRQLLAAAAAQVAGDSASGGDGLGAPSRAEPNAETVGAAGGASRAEPHTAMLAGKYRLIRLLGAGGMGTVHEAINTWTGRRVAVKQLRRAVLSDATATQRFMREARTASQIEHPSVVDILDLGEDPETGALFMVQELLAGATLRQRLAERGALTIDEAVQIAVPALAALAHAHAAGVVHRDIKPDNIFLARDLQGGELPKLIDFGLSRPVQVEADLAITEHGRQLGTPFYMSPEQLRGESVDERTDVWSIGVVLFEAVAGARPFPGPAYHQLVVQILNEPVPRLAELAPAVPAAFSEIVARALDRDRALRPSARELHDSLDELGRRPEILALPAGNPYRGIVPFEAEHRGVFFGRAREVSALVGRIRSESFVLVAGDSGVGKSSLVRAGVLPAIGGDARVVIAAPGRAPLVAIAAVLAPVAGAVAAELSVQLATEPAAVGARLERALASQGTDRPGPRLVLFVDQLEELITLADDHDAAAISAALPALLEAAPSLRLIATVRSDFLAKLAALPGLGDSVTRALYLLKPLTRHAVREAVVGPARVTGLRFEAPELIEELVGSAGASGGELPLLQFALAALWEARDVEHGLIRQASLAAMGGVAGALARHADAVIASLAPGQRAIARAVILAMITDEGTRARRTADELSAAAGGAGGDAASEVVTGAVIEALVRGRLITVEHVADQPASYQIAHDVLVDGWDTLRGWRGHDAERIAARQRLSRAAADWDRLGRPADALWKGRQLVETAELDASTLAAVDAAFLVQSRRAARRRRFARNAAILAIPLLVAIGFTSARLASDRQLRREVAVHVAAAEAAIASAAREDSLVIEARRTAFTAFDRDQPVEGEAAWARALEHEAALDGHYAIAAEKLETALALDSNDRDVRRRFATLLYDRARFAERAHRSAQRDELVHRMRVYDDDGGAYARWQAPAQISITSAPSGAEVSAQRYVDERGRLRLTEAVPLGATPIASYELAPGSYVITVRAPDRVVVRAPLLVERGEPIDLAIPAPAAIPAGYVFVPPGRFLYGSNDIETMRRTMLNAQPLHAVTTPGYLIARHEVTFADWIAFLGALPVAERVQRSPHTTESLASPGAYIALVELRPGAHQLTLRPTVRVYTAGAGQPIEYGDRATGARQDWLRMPVSGVSYDDGAAYAAWLARTGALPGARMCAEREWERATRGADGRLFPHGDALAADDANTAETYGRQPAAFGPDEVGSHPASDSPFGVADLTGNVWEWVSSGDSVAARGGSWYHNPLAARSNNREPSERSLRDIAIGVRVCANVSEPGRSANGR